MTQVESQVPGGRVLDLSDAKLSDFSRSLAAELASMPVGGVTTPIKADSGYTMLKLCQLNLDGVAGLGTEMLHHLSLNQVNQSSISAAE